MRLLNRLKFALRHDFGQEFIVFSIPDQSAVQFLDYKDAREFSEKQIQYKPKVMVELKPKPKRKENK